MKSITAPLLVAAFTFLTACVSSTSDIKDDGVVTAREASEYAVRNRKAFPSEELIFNTSTFKLWKIDHAGYSFAVVELVHHPIFALRKFNLKDALPLIEATTGCDIPEGLVSGRTHMEAGQEASIQLDC